MSQSFYRLNLGITKCYLLKCSGGYLLIDTAYPKDYEKFVKVDLVFESWQRLTEHGAERIYPAHGSPFSAEKLTRYRKRFTGK